MKENYGITKATLSLPVIDLLRVPHKGRTLVVAHPAFGPNFYSKNQEAMSQDYSHSKELPKITFKPATTSESISISSYDFRNLAKPEIFDPKWLQAGNIVRTQEGVFVNTRETDESKLKQMLNQCEKINEIYLGENDFGFVPYETFETGVQDSGTFIRGGLARSLEHTKEKVAENLGEITSRKNYKRGVNVWGFDEVSEPILKVASLYSGRLFVGVGLGVGGDYWGGYDDGCAFGVLTSEKSE